MFNLLQRQELLSLAHQSIHSGLAGQQRLPWPGTPCAGLDILRATFVTLKVKDELRGCCGSLEADRSIAEDVWRNAWAAAFSDRRFTALTGREYPGCRLHISVLSELTPLPAATQAELLHELRPGVDGLLLQSGSAQATFLPVVWEQLPDRSDFLRHLKMKAGWSTDAWPQNVRAWRYTTESFGEAPEH
ncbi:MAG TPA: AmmeMemoRadiSam system protein A [Povalibacter sp.]